MSRTYRIKTVQKIPVSIDIAWEFFSNPSNLKDITPDNLGFTIISSEQENKMYAGQVIEYKVSPVLGIPIYWMTEITHVKYGNYFVDEQRFGPYQLWHHQHHFKKVEGGIEMTDIVHYKLPFWILGDLAQALFVKCQLREIFDFRFHKVENLFGIVKT